jgi:hypothetical protein
VGLHSGNRWLLLESAGGLTRRLTTAAGRIEALAGRRPCPVFRPHGGWRSAAMYAGLRRIDYTLVGWGWMLWDVDWFRPRTAERTVSRIAPRARGGDIVVLHDGDESAPRTPQPQTVVAAARLIAALRGRGFQFGTICPDHTERRED